MMSVSYETTERLMIMNKEKSKKAPAGKGGASKMSLLDAAAVVLAGSKEPMTVGAMLDEAARRRLWAPSGGKTPRQSLYSAIFREIAVKGDEARFVKSGRGLFSFRRQA